MGYFRSCFRSCFRGYFDLDFGSLQYFRSFTPKAIITKLEYSTKQITATIIEFIIIELIRAGEDGSYNNLVFSFTSQAEANPNLHLNSKKRFISSKA